MISSLTLKVDIDIMNMMVPASAIYKVVRMMFLAETRNPIKLTRENSTSRSAIAPGCIIIIKLGLMHNKNG